MPTFSTSPSGRIRILTFFAVVWPYSSTPAAYLILKKDERRIECSNIRLNAKNDYVVETKSGSQTYPASLVARAEADKPAGFEQAIAFEKSGDFASSISAFKEIAKKNRGLGWDDKAYASISRLYIRQNKYPEAVKALESMGKEMLRQSDIQGIYWKALLESREFDTLSAQLDHAIKRGDRSLAARAQILRGDMNMKRRQLESAALDYLRTVALFKAEKNVQPEALYKAGLVLEELRHEKARDMFDQLIKEYPESTYAREAKNR